tara:strand:+ start:376 stop:903 length:528 start_codon:yes stop_codon:yes gene_type:complete
MHYLQKQLLEEEKKKAKLNAGHCKTESEKLDESKKKKNGEKARSVLTKANIPHDMVMGVIRVPANLVGKVEALLDKEFGGMFKKRTGFKISGTFKEEYELYEQKGQKFNFARARKVFEKHWREMERKVVNELVQPYEGRGPVNYDLKAERQVSDYFETNTEDLLDYITERFEDLN